MQLYDLYCANCRKPYHMDLWKACSKCDEGAKCPKCGWCEKDHLEESCNVPTSCQILRAKLGHEIAHEEARKSKS